MKKKEPQKTVRMVCLATGELRDVPAGKPPAGFRPLDEVSKEELVTEICRSRLLSQGYKNLLRGSLRQTAEFLRPKGKGKDELELGEPVPIEGLPEGTEGISLTAKLSRTKASKKGKGGRWVETITLQKPVQKARVVLKKLATREPKPACH